MLRGLNTNMIPELLRKIADQIEDFQKPTQEVRIVPQDRMLPNKVDA